MTAVIFILSGRTLQVHSGLIEFLKWQLANKKKGGGNAYILDTTHIGVLLSCLNGRIDCY